MVNLKHISRLFPNDCGKARDHVGQVEDTLAPNGQDRLIDSPES